MTEPRRRNRNEYGALLGLICSLLFGTSTLADGPYTRPPPGPPPQGTPISITGTPPPPFASPKELYDHIKKDLGLETAQDEVPRGLPNDGDLKKRVQDLVKEYQACKDAQRKIELKKEIKEAELNREARKHQENVNDFVLRRKAFLADVVDALLAISVVNQTKDLRTIFRCGLDQMRSEFLEILKDLPQKEVTAYVWQKVEDQIRFSGPAAEARVAQLDAQCDQLKERLRVVRMRLNENPPASEKTKLSGDEDKLNSQISQIEFDRMIAQAGANNRTAKFIALAEDFLVAYGTPIVDFLVPVMYGPSPAVRGHAAGVIRRVGPTAVPRLIEACEKNPNDEIFALLAAISGKNLGRELKPWRDWWASVEDKVMPKQPAGNQPPKVVEGKKPEVVPPAQPDLPKPDAGKPDVAAPAVPKPEEKPDTDEWMNKLKEELAALRAASEKLRAARQHHAETMLFSNALERQLEDLTRKKDEGKEAMEAEIRKELADALRKEYSAKMEVDKIQSELDALRKKVQESDPATK